MRAPVAGLLFTLILCLVLPTLGLAEDAANDAAGNAAAATRLDIAKRYLDAVQASDWQGMATHLADDAHYQDFSMEFFGREKIDLRGSDAIIDFWRTSGDGAGTIEIRFDFPDPFVAGPNVFFVGASYVKNRGEAWGLEGGEIDTTFRQVTHLRIVDGRVAYHADHVDYASALADVETKIAAARAAAEDAAAEDAAAEDTAARLPEAARELVLEPIGSHSDKTPRPLADWRRANGLLVLFVSNQCPYVIDWADRFARFEALGKERQIGIVIVNSNARRRDSTDSPAAMGAFAAEHLGALPYLLDEGSRLADLLDARRTPEAVLYDGELREVYRGLIDDHSGPFDEVGQHHLREAFDGLVGLGPMPESTAPLGCSVQRPRRSRRP